MLRRSANNLCYLVKGSTFLRGRNVLDLGQLQQYLPNLNFPASKDEVVSEVQNNDAPQEVVDQIKNSSTDTFNSADEVLQTVQGNR